MSFVIQPLQKFLSRMEMNLSDDFIRVLNEKFKKILKKCKKWIYYKNNRERIKNKSKIYRENNRDTIRKKDTIFRQENREKLRYRKKQLRETDYGIKGMRITTWKQMGLICDDYSALYDKVINTTNCEECNVLLTVDKVSTATTRCMDHDHATGLFRNVLCNLCNIKRG